MPDISAMSGISTEEGIMFRRMFVVASVAWLAAGCAVPAVLPAPPPRMNPAPTLRDWSASVLRDAQTFNLPAIAEAGSEQLQQELAEVRALQSQLSDATQAQVNYWDAGAVVRWNEIARDLVSQHKTPPPKASRVYALLSVAQELAIKSAREFQQRFKRAAPSQLDSAIKAIGQAQSGFSCPSEAAAVAAASSSVLAYIYPDEFAALAQRAKEHMESRLAAGANVRSDLIAGETVGKVIGDTVVWRARTDGSDALWTGAVPAGSGKWTSAPNQFPLLPLWGQVKPWHLTSGSQFRPPPPPAFDTAEFNTALKEVRDLSDHRSAEQLGIALFWADGPGTATPPGHWNAIAAELIAKHNLDELQSAHVMAMMNTAMMDAGIGCWEAKYVYNVIRPSQADEKITLPVGLPNFPAYVSGHASFSGAASEILAHFFPEDGANLRAMAEEAAESRVYGGIHYRFDGEQGLKLGRAVAKLALAQTEKDLHG
jgi:membrane-associated phospholipid phosphatase